MTDRPESLPYTEGTPGTYCIACDSDGCPNIFTLKGNFGEELKLQARAEAFRFGWHLGTVDLCPEHI